MATVLNAFIDESGDRGASGKSSPYFMMAAVTIDEKERPVLAAAVAQIKSEFGIPLSTALHWSNHCRDFARRQRVTAILEAVPNIQLNYVVIAKATIPQNAALRGDHSAFYNYTAGVLMDRILLGAQYWPEGEQPVRAFFGHVRGMDHSGTLNYFKQVGARHTFAKWSLLDQLPKFIATNQNSGVQAADQFVGMLSLAIKPDKFGGYEPQHLMQVRKLIRRGPNGQALNYGLKVFAQQGFPQSLPWWPK